jgi:hypothetical protein
MLAELEVIPDRAVRRRFTVGCVRALFVEVITARLRDWTAHPVALVIALAAGLVIAALDQASDTRGPMWIALAATSTLFAWWRPGAAWRWGLVLALGIPLFAVVSGTYGPYVYDPADTMYGIPPAIVIALVVGRVRRRIPPRMIAIVAISVAWGTRQSDAQSAIARRELPAADIAPFADSVFATYLQGSPQPSLAFLVVKDGAIVFARGYGMEDAAGGRAVDPDSTIFWLGSITKLLTAEAMMREVDRGRVTLDAAATRYLGWRLPSRSGWRAITVEDLLTHTAGLERLRAATPCRRGGLALHARVRRGRGLGHPVGSAGCACGWTDLQCGRRRRADRT